MQLRSLLFTKPSCVQCTATYRALDAKGIDYDVVDLSEDAAALEQVKSLGYLQAPVVITDEDHWSGFPEAPPAALRRRGLCSARPSGTSSVRHVRRCPPLQQLLPERPVQLEHPPNPDRRCIRRRADVERAQPEMLAGPCCELVELHSDGGGDVNALLPLNLRDGEGDEDHRYSGDDDAIKDRRGEDPEPPSEDRGRDVQQRDREPAEPTSPRPALAGTVLADMRVRDGATVAVGVDDRDALRVCARDGAPATEVLDLVPDVDGVPAVVGGDTGRDLLGPDLLPVDELIIGRGQLPLEPLGVGAGRCDRDLDIPAGEGASGTVETSTDPGKVCTELLDPVRHSDRRVPRIVRRGRDVGTHLGAPCLRVGVDRAADRRVRLRDRSAVAGLRVVSDLDGLATFRETSQRACCALRLLCGVLLAPSGALRQCGSAVVPAVDQVSLDDGRSPAFIVDRNLDNEPGRGELLGGAVDDRGLRFAVAGVGDVPGSERPAPPPAVGLESIGRAVAPAGPFDEGAFRGSVDDHLRGAVQALVLLHAQVVGGVDERPVGEPTCDRVAEAFDETAALDLQRLLVIGHGDDLGDRLPFVARCGDVLLDRVADARVVLVPEALTHPVGVLRELARSVAAVGGRGNVGGGDQQVDGVAVHGKRAHDETPSVGGECDIHYPRAGSHPCQCMMMMMPPQHPQPRRGQGGWYEARGAWADTVGIVPKSLSMNEIRARAAQFTRDWQDEPGDERQQAQSFVRDLLGVYGITQTRAAFYEKRVKRSSTGSRGYIDALIPGLALIEMKSAGKDLVAAEQQALDYIDDLPDPEVPRWVITSDFRRFRLLDLHAESEGVQEFTLPGVPRGGGLSGPRRRDRDGVSHRAM
uniref:Glutaredoxin domain-containing protein n=1 Tax=Acrobeloides nanus TaxID=290746 RepID=A0A914CVS0_9BILA